MIAWMLYTVIVGLCVVVAAAAGDWLARLVRHSVRFVWIGAAAFCIVLAATARLRTTPAASGQRIDPSAITLVQTSMQSLERNAPPSTTWYAIGVWVLMTALVALSFTIVYVRFRRARRAWPTTDLHGHRVRVAPATGPIVIGVVRPEIVVPRWVLSQPDEEQRLILEHEAAHLLAADPLVLGAACLVVALMPWNPALWIILSRVRLAIELDCDARVLRGGVSPRAYGSLLVDVAERASPLRYAAMALADNTSHLHRRIAAMDTRRITHPIVRGATGALIGIAGLLAACEAKMPTTADINRMDAASAERSVHALAHVTPDSAIVWVVDGVETSAATAKAIPPDSIVQVSVNKLAPGSVAHVYVVTKRGVGLAVANEEHGPPTPPRRRLAAGDSSNPVKALAPAVERDQPIVIVDGKRSDPSIIKTLDRTRIERIDVLKGEAAIQQYGNDAVRGVIVVTTKP
jgi:beta-lactamase regulating signal transducer with metallopeptidase domain